MDSGQPLHGFRNDEGNYFFIAAARSTNVLPPFIL
jgi:hypothetical protein